MIGPRVGKTIHAHAAGIDVGSAQHYVAVPVECDPQPVQTFGSFTADLHRLAPWLRACGIETVVMQATGFTGWACMRFWTVTASRSRW